MHVLIVESERTTAVPVRDGVIGAGMTADMVIGGEQAVRQAASAAYDMVVLGVSLPGIDGFETCRRLRAVGVSTPVLMLSARDAIEDCVAGLNAGADDYLTKPFSTAELSARLRALARRGPLREDL
jgi:two-component system OmpR family response regulator